MPHSTPHMTGIAVYGRNWRQVAPMLVTCPPHDAWDTWSGPTVLPHAHLNRLIQHVFRRHDRGWVVPSLGILDREAVVFHQDKQGRMIGLLDAERYGSECSAHPLFNYVTVNKSDNVMRKFYSAQNVTKAIVAHGKRFKFEAVGIHGGAVNGAYSTEVEDEQVALEDLTCNPSTGVTEVSQEEWENATKKRLR